MHVRKFFYLLHLQEHPFTFARFLGVEEEKQMVFTGISIHPRCLLENWKGKEGDRGLGQEEEEGSSQAQTNKYKCIQAANITQKHILIQIYIQTYNIRHIHTRTLSTFIFGACCLSPGTPTRIVPFLPPFFFTFVCVQKGIIPVSFLSTIHAVLTIRFLRHMHLLSTKEPKEKHYSHGRNKNH